MITLTTELRKRLLSSIVITLVVVGLRFFDEQPLLMALLGSLLSFFLMLEYYALCLQGDTQTTKAWRYIYAGFAAVAAFVGAYVGFSGTPFVLIALVMACGYWCCLFSSLHRRSLVSARFQKPMMRLFTGLVISFGFNVALLSIYPAFLFPLMIVVLVDVGGYFIGKRYGTHKIAPNVSPNKSWEGFFGGALLIFLLFLVTNLITEERHLFHFSMFDWKFYGYAFGMLALALLSALIAFWGDLYESSLKRAKGVKDSGHIIPGHGGLWDRIDGHVAYLPFYALYTVLFL